MALDFSNLKQNIASFKKKTVDPEFFKKATTVTPTITADASLSSGGYNYEYTPTLQATSTAALREIYNPMLQSQGSATLGIKPMVSSNATLKQPNSFLQNLVSPAYASTSQPQDRDAIEYERLVKEGKITSIEEDAKNRGDSSEIDQTPVKKTTTAKGKTTIPTSDTFFTSGGDFTNYVLSKKPVGSKGGQCVQFAHEITNFPKVGDTASEKTSYFNSLRKSGQAYKFGESTPQVGDVVLWNSGQSGHAAVITGINSDGTLTIVESNKNLNEKITTRNIKPKSTTSLGFVKGTPKQNFSWSVGKSNNIYQGDSDMATTTQPYDYDVSLEKAKQLLAGGASGADVAMEFLSSQADRMAQYQQKYKDQYQNFQPEIEQMNLRREEYRTAGPQAFADYLNMPLEVRVAMSKGAKGRAGAAWQTSFDVLNEKRKKPDEMMALETEKEKQFMNLLGIMSEEEARKAAEEWKQKEFNEGVRQFNINAAQATGTKTYDQTDLDGFIKELNTTMPKGTTSNIGQWGAATTTDPRLSLSGESKSSITPSDIVDSTEPIYQKYLEKYANNKTMQQEISSYYLEYRRRTLLSEIMQNIKEGATIEELVVNYPEYSRAEIEKLIEG